MSVPRIIDLGRMPYAPALEYQRELHVKVAAGLAEPTVLLVEHDPVITVSRRKTAPQHLLASREHLAALGIDVQETDRGGDVTYHGPGQLVAYPIVRLAPLGVHIAGYMRLLEQIVIEAIAPFGVVGLRDACATGVWVEMRSNARAEVSNAQSSMSKVQSSTVNPPMDPKSPHHACASASSAPTSTAKLAALGVRLSRGVTLHGLALNVTTNLAHFNTIVPCGLVGRTVTSLAQVLGERTPAMEEVKSQLAGALQRRLTAHAPHQPSRG